MPLTTFVAVWACLAIIVLAPALARYLVSLREDDTIHLRAAEEPMITRQMGIVHRLHAINSPGENLTIVTVAVGPVLAGLYICHHIQ